MTLSRFAKLFRRSGAPGLLSHFGETITYYPGSGASRQITALVDRSQAPDYYIRVLNSTATGISSAELDTGTDEVSFPLRVGDPVARKAIQELQEDASGMTRFKVS